MSKHVCLDPGHYSGIAGKRSPDGTYAEHEFNLDMAKRMKKLLEDCGVQVTLTRDRDVDVSLRQRVAIANKIKGLDLFVSIHTNAATNGWSSAKGYVVYTSQAGDAAKRNIAAGAILKQAKAAGITIRNGGLAHSLFFVLRYTAAPAVLIEHGFHTSRDEVALLKTDAYRQKLAEADCKGICDYLRAPWSDETATGEKDYREAVKSRFGLADVTMEHLAAYQYGDELLKKLATKK